jgi:hypothetical protein
MANQELFELQTALVKINVQWLKQAQALLEAMDDKTFTKTPPNLAPHRVSGHVRHIVEFYECFLAGLGLLHIDYDARRRDPQLESSRAAAIARIRDVIAQLELDPALREDGAIFVRVEDSAGLPEPFLLSSVGREMQVLASHTIHHFALIAVTLRALGHRVAHDFGVAPSTLRYRATVQEPAREFADAAA